jgi:hypothetical protein
MSLDLTRVEGAVGGGNENGRRNSTLSCKARSEKTSVMDRIHYNSSLSAKFQPINVCWRERCILGPVIWSLTGPMTATYLCVKSAMGYFTQVSLRLVLGPAVLSSVPRQLPRNIVLLWGSDAELYIGDRVVWVHDHSVEF